MVLMRQCPDNMCVIENFLVLLALLLTVTFYIICKEDYD